MSHDGVQKIRLGQPGRKKPVRDPVCGMFVDPTNPPGGSHEHVGKTYCFCNPRCREKFAADPETFLRAGPSMAQMERARSGPPSAVEKDPVCGMEVDPAQAAGGEHEHAGTTYFFCNPGCRDRFVTDPARYLGADAVRVILEGRREQPVGVFNLDDHPHLKLVHVQSPDLGAYRVLAGGAS